MKKICITCGKEFETNKNAQKSCSEVCRKIRSKYTDKRKIGKYKVDKICPVCNKNFKGNKTQIACSIKCASEQRKTKLIKKCLRCGKEFKVKRKGQKYCSRECGAPKRTLTNKQLEIVKNLRSKGYAQLEIAKHLGIGRNSLRRIFDENNIGTIKNFRDADFKETYFKNNFENNYTTFKYVGGHTNNDGNFIMQCKFCGSVQKRRSKIAMNKKNIRCSNCDRILREKNRETKESEKNRLALEKQTRFLNGEYTITCSYCGEKFNTNNKRKFCTDICQDNYLKTNRYKRYKMIECEDCGEKFITVNADKCKSCMKKAETRRKDISRRTKIKQNGVVNWDISLNKLYKKYRGVCAICGEKCNFNDCYYDDNNTFIAGNKYPSVDHMIPIAKGGTHTWDNVQLAHRYCNSIKSDKFIENDKGQLRFF